LAGAYGMDILDLKNIVVSGTNLNPIRFAQMLATIIGFGLPALVFSKLKTGSWIRYSGIQNRFPALLIILVPLLVISAYPMINVSYFINQHAFFADWLKSAQEEYELLTNALMSGTSISIFLINLFTIAIFPAIAEEWFFRGTVQPLLRERTNMHIAIIVTAVIFSLIHFEFSGFLPRVCLGILLGYIYQLSGSLWVSIWAHLFNNGMEVTLRFLKNTGRIDMEMGEPALPGTWEALGFTAAFAVLGYAFYFISRKKFDTFA
jgi:membrane protease YdiL (CAAX protease family)